MSSPADSPTIDTMKQDISGDLNSTLLLVMLTGIYVMVYVYTIYLYETQKKNRNLAIVLVLSALCAIVVAIVGTQWRLMNLTFVENSHTMQSIVLFSIFGDAGLVLLSTMLQYAAYILADGLLLWRCYAVLGKSKLLFYFPLFMYACEIALCVVSLVLYGMQKFQLKDSQRLALSFIIVTGTLSTVTAITSISATFIICLKISAFFEDRLGMKTRYMHIIRMLVESSALYSICSVLVTIDTILMAVSPTPFSANGRVALSMSEYVTSLNMVATGLAPTLMVAQVCLSSGAGSAEDIEHTHQHVSALEFDHPNTVEDEPRGSRSSEYIV